MTSHEHTCEFCNELCGGTSNSFRFFIPESSLETRIVHQTANFVVLPSLGALLPGYVLVLPKKHVYSIGQVSHTQFWELTQLLNEIRDIIEAKFATNTVVFEHAATSTTRRGGACLDHAHLHVCPLSKNSAPFINITQRHIRHDISHLQELRAFGEQDKPYLYYEDPNGRKVVYDLLEDIPSQYLRKVLAKSLSMSQEWDWAVFPKLDHLLKTIDAFKTYPTIHSVVSSYDVLADEYFRSTNSLEPLSEIKKDADCFISHLLSGLILDAGAGSCRDAVYFAEHGFQVEAIDMAKDLLMLSNDSFPVTSKRVMDIRNLAYANNVFDGIWCSAVMLHFGQWQFRQVLNEFWRVLKNNGLLHLSVKAGSGHAIREFSGSAELQRNYVYYQLDQVQKLVEWCGFGVWQVKTAQEADSRGEMVTWIKCLAMK